MEGHVCALRRGGWGLMLPGVRRREQRHRLCGGMSGGMSSSGSGSGGVRQQQERWLAAAGAAAGSGSNGSRRVSSSASLAVQPQCNVEQQRQVDGSGTLPAAAQPTALVQLVQLGTSSSGAAVAEQRHCAWRLYCRRPRGCRINAPLSAPPVCPSCPHAPRARSTHPSFCARSLARRSRVTCTRTSAC